MYGYLTFVLAVLFILVHRSHGFFKVLNLRGIGIDEQIDFY